MYRYVATTAAVLALSIGFGAMAFAADLGPGPAPIYTKAPPPPPAWGWTGWYAGVNVGAGFGNVKTDFGDAPYTVTNALGGSATFPAPGFIGSNKDHPDGFIGGGQIGYNWQFSPVIVAGLEADFQGALQKDSNNLSNAFNQISGANVAIGTTATNYTSKIDWFGTVRGRVGYLWGNGQLLTYVTGGLAYGQVDLEGTSVASGTVNGVLPFAISQAFGHSQVNAGWVAGAGTEGRLANSNWSWKLEGLYMDLGTLNATGAPGTSFGPCPLCGAGAAPFTGTGGQVSTHTSFTDIIVRAGLNYQFH
jgi:outer membrane immunogenic protein